MPQNHGARRHTTLRVKAELDGAGYPARAAAAADPTAPSKPPLASATAQVRRKLRGAELRAEVGVNRRLLAGGAMGPAHVPLNAALDVGTPASSASAFQYRVGLHHVRRPPAVCWVCLSP